MNGKELINILNDLGFTPRNLYSDYNSYEQGFNEEKIKEKVGNYEEIEILEDDASNYGGKEYWYWSRKVVVLFFKEHNIYLKGGWYYGSYDTSEEIPWKEVKPVQKIVYE